MLTEGQASCLADCTGILEMYNNAACRNKCQQHRKCKKVLRELNLKLLQREGSLVRTKTKATVLNKSKGVQKISMFTKRVAVVEKST